MFKSNKSKIAAVALSLSVLALAGCGNDASSGKTGAAAGGDSAKGSRISMVGSSTVFPFASAVAESFATATGVQVPKVESTGTGGGMKIFCSGVGSGSVDIENASRPMKKSEYDDCQKNGVKEISEIKIGFDGIVLANGKDGQDLKVSRQDLYKALAKEVVVNGKLAPNPYINWSDVNPALPKTKIDVLGPPPTSGTRDAFAELIMEKGAESDPVLKALKAKDKDAFKKAATTLREDGAWKDMGENDNLIVQAIEKNPEAVGIFGYSYYEQNKDKVKAATIEGKLPELADIVDGSYPAARSLYFYVKKQNIAFIPAIKDYAAEFVSEKAAGANGYLITRGLVPLPADQLKAQQKVAAELPLMAAPKE